MQLYKDGFHFKGNIKSHSSYFSSNPDNRSKNEISVQKRKNKDREEEHIKIRGEKLDSKNESDISYKIEGKKQCSCRGTNLNCYKCNGSGFVEEDFESLLLCKPIIKKEPDDKKKFSQNKVIKLSSKNLKKSKYKCPYCKREHNGEESLRTHINNIHKKQKKNIKSQENQSSFYCKYCNKKLKGKKALRDHINSNHSAVSNNQIQMKIKKYKKKQKDGLKIVKKRNENYSVKDFVEKGWTLK